MRIQYEDWKPGAKAWALIQTAETICQDYLRQGYNLSLRQLYYQFVAGGIIPNNMQSYKNLGSVVNRARMAGLLDWDYIVDRTRSHAGGRSTLMADEVVRLYRRANSINRWAKQPVYVEAWVEKEALVDVIERAASAVQIPYFACRGYVSQSEQHNAGQRLLDRIQDGKRVMVLHLGDHDPSGIDMTRDITDRLTRFIDVGFTEHGGPFDDDEMSYIHEDVADAFGGEYPLEIRRIALNMDQVIHYNPPPNPAKITDSRAVGYIREHGYQSWELDALEPSVIVDLIRSNVEPVIDWDLWQEDADLEATDREALTALADRWPEVREFLGV